MKNLELVEKAGREFNRDFSWLDYDQAEEFKNLVDEKWPGFYATIENEAPCAYEKNEPRSDQNDKYYIDIHAL